MASKRIFKKNLNDMVFDIVEECFYLQMVDDSKTKKTEALIDETAAFQDEVLGKISKFKTKKEFVELTAYVGEKGKYFVEQLNALNK
jgi:hypothetical protein